MPDSHGPPLRHVLCVHPYRRTQSSTTSFPPLGLEYIAAALRPYTDRIELINFRHEARPSTSKHLRRETDLICYSVNWAKELELVRQDIQSVPADIMTILGGRAVTEDPHWWLENCPNVDAVVCGDGEQAIVEVAQGRPWSEIAGLCHRDSDGRILHNAPRPNAALDDSLMPARDLRRRKYYLTSKGISTGITIDKVAGSRGCPFNCRFCSFSVNPWGVKRNWAPRSAESIVREIEQIDADLILFVDDVFTHDPKRVTEICDLLIARGIRKHYIANARLEIAKHPEVLRKMEKAGFLALLIGLESTQDVTLHSMGKGFNIETIRRYFEVLRTSRMILNAYFIVGNIGETEEQMLSTVEFARSLGVDLVHVSRLRCERYSGLIDLVEQSSGYHIDHEGFVYSDAYSAEHIANLRKQIDRQFHTPKHVAKVIWKLARHLHPHVKYKALLTMPLFLAKLIVSQAGHEAAKRMRKRTSQEQRPRRK